VLVAVEIRSCECLSRRQCRDTGDCRVFAFHCWGLGVSNYRVITGKYRRILRFLVFLLQYGLYCGKDGIIVRRLVNSG